MENNKLNHLLDRLLILGNYKIDKENEDQNIANLELLVEKLEQDSKNRKLTIIKILPNDLSEEEFVKLCNFKSDKIGNYYLTPQQINVFKMHEMQINTTINFIKIGNDNKKPTLEEIEKFKKSVEEVLSCSNPTIITHYDIKIVQLENTGKVIIQN